MENNIGNVNKFNDLNKEIEFYNEILGKVSDELDHYSEQVEISKYQRILNLQARIIVEAMTNVLFGKNPKDFFSNNRSNSAAFNILSEGLHYHLPANSSIYLYNRILLHLTDIIKNALGDSTSILELKSISNKSWDSKVKIIPKGTRASSYKGIVLKYVPQMSFGDYSAYELVRYDRGYNQETKKIAFSKKGDYLSENVVYSFTLIKMRIEIGGEEIKFDFDLIEKAENARIDLDEKKFYFKNVLNKYYYEEQNRMHILKYIKSLDEFNEFTGTPQNFYDDEIVQSLINTIKKMKKSIPANNLDKQLVDNLISLKYHHLSKLSTFEEAYNLMQFEYWTKTAKNAYVSLSDKDIYFKLLGAAGISLSSDMFCSRENEVLKQTFSKEKVYKKNISNEYHNKILQGQKFNHGYDEYSILKEGDATLFNWYKQSIDKILAFSSLSKNDLSPFRQHLSLVVLSSPANIIKILENKLTIIFGHAGTGKTTMVTELIKILKNVDSVEEVLFLAPTYKATRIIKDETLPESRLGTVQKMLLKRSGKLYYINDLRKVKTLIIDEISMLDDQTYHSLSLLLKDEYSSLERVVLIGDVNQLPPMHSVGFHMEFPSLFGDDEIIRLNKTQRQQGRLKNYVDKFLETKELNNDISLESNGKLIQYYENENELYEKLREIKNVDNSSKILTPFNNGPYGTRMLNIILKGGENNFKVNDQVIINETSNESQLKKIIYKNNLLNIEKIENDTRIIFREKMKYPFEIGPWSVDEEMNLVYNFANDKNANKNREEIPFTHANAITFHASQGSGFSSVVVIIPKSSRMSFENLYTAISRVKSSDTNDLKILIHSADSEYYLKELSTTYN